MAIHRPSWPKTRTEPRAARAGDAIGVSLGSVAVVAPEPVVGAVARGATLRPRPCPLMPICSRHGRARPPVTLAVDALTLQVGERAKPVPVSIRAKPPGLAPKTLVAAKTIRRAAVGRKLPRPRAGAGVRPARPRVLPRRRAPPSRLGRLIRIPMTLARRVRAWPIGSALPRSKLVGGDIGITEGVDVGTRGVRVGHRAVGMPTFPPRLSRIALRRHERKRRQGQGQEQGRSFHAQPARPREARRPHPSISRPPRPRAPPCAPDSMLTAGRPQRAGPAVQSNPGP